MISFSPWVHWHDRSTLAEGNRPGTYVLGKFEGAPPAIVDPTDERVILIAETHNQTLQKRWMRFHHGATRGKRGHAGADTFWRLYGNGNAAPIPGWLFVAASAAPDAQDAQDVTEYVQRVKDELLAHYVERHGVNPQCNRRGPKGVAIAVRPVLTEACGYRGRANRLPRRNVRQHT